MDHDCEYMIVSFLILGLQRYEKIRGLLAWKDQNSYKHSFLYLYFLIIVMTSLV